MSDLKDVLIEKFRCWKPKSPTVLRKSTRDVDMCWLQEERPFGFLGDLLLYKVQKKDKLPEWITVYSGGKTTKSIDNLAPANPHKFKLQVILKSTGVPQLVQRALEFYGNEENLIQSLTNHNKEINDTKEDLKNKIEPLSNEVSTDNAYSNETIINNQLTNILHRNREVRWLESLWSDGVWTNTESGGTSAVCFSMAVKCGYLKQVQHMLDERPGLIDIINSTNGLTPLTTAVRKGDINMVKFLVNSGAAVAQASGAGRRALHEALSRAHIPIAQFLLERGADLHTCDVNGLRAEHHAVDSGRLRAVCFVFDRGGDARAADRNGWTPLFRAVIQGADAAIVEELVRRGSDINVVDNAGISLAAAARCLRGRGGRSRDSILRLVDAQYSHEKAVANFARITKKISSVQSFIK